MEAQTHTIFIIAVNTTNDLVRLRRRSFPKWLEEEAIQKPS